MKKITSNITKASTLGDDAISFIKSKNELTSSFKSKIPIDGGTVVNGVKTWINNNIIIYADNEKFMNVDNTTPIHFGVVIVQSPMVKILAEMNITRQTREVDALTLAKELVVTYRDSGCHDWIKDGTPPGIRMLLAYRYGYTLNAEYHAAFDEAMIIADDVLLELKNGA